MNAFTNIHVRRDSRDKLFSMKGENSMNDALAAILSFFSIFTADNKEIFSYLMKEGARSIFIGGFLYRKMCVADQKFLQITINLAEDLTLVKFQQLAMIMVKEVRRRPEFEDYVEIADEMEEEMLKAAYDMIISTDTTQILFEMGVGFQL